MILSGKKVRLTSAELAAMRKLAAKQGRPVGEIKTAEDFIKAMLRTMTNEELQQTHDAVTRKLGDTSDIKESDMSDEDAAVHLVRCMLAADATEEPGPDSNG